MTTASTALVSDNTGKGYQSSLPPNIVKIVERRKDSGYYHLMLALDVADKLIRN